ncbi:MAG: hypothetical protein WAL56_00100 [Candidatus Sulfotelmatobacter sp.]
MGIVADIPNTTVDFRDPKKNVPMLPISNLFVCVQHAFEMTFSFSFNPDPKKGIAISPKVKELWQIGIVQNVLFEMYNFEYDDGSVFKVEFPHAVIDTGASIYLPFYNDPVRIPACVFDHTLSCGKFLPIMIPATDIWQTSLGYGELLDPWSATGVAIDNQPSSLNMIDEPFFGARLRLKNGALISRAESISAFQTWLVAQHGPRVEVLATVPPFSLVFWLTTRPSTGMLSIDTPPHDFGFYGESGISRHVRVSGHTATVLPRLGSGGRKPVLTGQTANDRANNWIQSQGLVPDPVVFKTP